MRYTKEKKKARNSMLKDTMKSTFFSSKSFLIRYKGYGAYLGILAFLVNVFIFVLPTNKESLYHLPSNFVFAFIGMLILMAINYLFICLVRLRMLSFYDYFNSINIVFMASLLLISVPAFLISHWLVNVVFKNQILGLFLFTLIPYYNFILFGWLSEMASREKGFKAIIIALFAITLLLLYQTLLGYFTV